MFVTFNMYFMVLNNLHELGLSSSSLPSLTWVTLLVLMILPYFFVALTKTLFCFSYMWIIWSYDHLGLEITHSIEKLYITQAKYASKLFSRARLTNSKTVDTPVELNAHLTPSTSKLLTNPPLYKRLVGSLVYLTVSRPDISYAVHQVS